MSIEPLQRHLRFLVAKPLRAHPSPQLEYALHNTGRRQAPASAVETQASRTSIEVTSPTTNPAPGAESDEEDVKLETLPDETKQEVAEPPPSPPAEAVAPSRQGDASLPLSLAATWAAAQAKPKVATRLIVVSILGLGTLGISTLLYSRTDLLRHMPTLQPPSVESLVGGGVVRQDRDAWLKDVLAAKNETSHAWDPVLTAAASPPRAAVTAPKPSPTTPSRRRIPPQENSAPAGSSLPPVGQGDNFYGNIFGSFERYRAASSRPSSRGNGAPVESSKAPNVQGLVVYTRLQDEVASDPSNAPVIATLRRKARLGDIILAAGTEVHGKVTGSSDTRVYVDFEFARTPDGERNTLRSSARDKAGRTGVPGRRQLTRATTGSIGIASAAAGIAAASRNLAGEAGDALGAAIEAAGSASADKAKHIDRDEYVVVVPKNTDFAVYVETIGTVGGS